MMLFLTKTIKIYLEKRGFEELMLSKQINILQKNYFLFRGSNKLLLFFYYYSTIILPYYHSMDIELKESNHPKAQQHHFPDYSHCSDEEIQAIDSKVAKGCNGIFHRPGYMNSKGNAPYDFTCDSSHLCPKCQEFRKVAITPLKGRQQAAKILQENTERVHQKLAFIRKQLFEGQPGCACKKEKLCNKCVDRLQAEVYRYQKGCGKQWIEEFGGMAAGPASVSCADNTFVCDKCTQELAFIQKIVQKQYPYLNLTHIKAQQIPFWSPSYQPVYYTGILDQI